MTKILGIYHVATREELFYKLGSGEVSIDDYLNVNTSRGARSLVSRLFRLGFGGDNKKTKVKKLLSVPDSDTAAKAARPKINTKERPTCCVSTSRRAILHLPNVVVRFRATR